MATLSNQVQLRGGSTVEHESFTGVPREVTVDTDMWTLRVHDGYSVGGYPLITMDTFRLTENRLDSKIETDVKRLDNRIDDMQNNLGGSHNHDDIYVRKIANTVSPTLKNDGTYWGLANNTGDDGGWVRTTKSGLIPYQHGGYSGIGSPSWRFNDGWFNALSTYSLVDTHTINMGKINTRSRINFAQTVNDPGFLEHVEENNNARMVFSVSDDMTDGDQFWFGATPGGIFRSGAIITSDGRMYLNRYIETGVASMTMGGRHIYFDGQRPSNAPEGSISFG